MTSFNIDFNRLKKDFIRYLNEHATEMFNALCYSDFQNTIDPWYRFTDFIFMTNRIELYLDADGINRINNADDINEINDILYSAITEEFLETNNTDYLKIINEFIKSKTKIFIYDVYGTMAPTTYTKTLLGECYHFIRKYIRTQLENKQQAIPVVDFIREALQHCPTIINLNLSDGELFALSILAADIFGNKIFNIKIQQHNRKYYMHSELANNQLIDKLHTYIKQNLRNLLLHADLDKDENNMYSHSWINTRGEYESDIEHDILAKCLMKNKNQIFKYLNINPMDDWEFDNIIDYYCQQYPSILSDIYNIIRARNGKIKKMRAEDLIKLQDDDKIGIKDSTSIDYDITADHVRSRPIIIIHDMRTNKDMVMFGPNGSSHGYYIQNKLPYDCAKKNIEVDPNKMGYGYALHNIAFIDEQGDNFQYGYTNDEIVNILKSDPHIKKVYTTPGHPAPGGGMITRLAKKIK